ncbi:MAG: D-sedoheptulose 7-phosphate isomerase [Deferribacteraceae bacterium]|nr:D-sedoheptulose 7-phosphate isomerase [Deferribacteraceae bacterium]
MEELVKTSIDAKQRLLADKALLKTVEAVVDATVAAYRNGNKVLAAGNGGSAADAQHFVAEFVGRFYYDRPALPGIALHTDTSVLTAIGNDYGYESVFSRQIEANAVKGDVFFGFSTSGNSANILKAIEAAKAKGVICVGFVGAKPSKMDAVCDFILKMPSEDTPRIQECHALLEHIICQCVESALFPK